jgi:hypothetical protein
VRSIERTPSRNERAGDSDTPLVEREVPTMTASDAFREWAEERTGITQSVTGTGIAHAAFLAGYRRALEDAADAIQALHPGEVKNSVTFLRNMAAGSGNNGGRDE